MIQAKVMYTKQGYKDELNIDPYKNIQEQDRQVTE